MFDDNIVQPDMFSIDDLSSRISPAGSDTPGVHHEFLSEIFNCTVQDNEEQMGDGSCVLQFQPRRYYRNLISLIGLCCS